MSIWSLRVLFLIAYMWSSYGLSQVIDAFEDALDADAVGELQRFLIHLVMPVKAHVEKLRRAVKSAENAGFMAFRVAFHSISGLK